MSPANAAANKPRASVRSVGAGNPFATSFERLWNLLGGPELTREHRFSMQRKWRLDYYHGPSRIGIELDGGVWSGGRHTRGSGFLKDCEKLNAATAEGIRVFRLGTGMVTQAHLLPIIKATKEKL